MISEQSKKDINKHDRFAIMSDIAYCILNMKDPLFVDYLILTFKVFGDL